MTAPHRYVRYSAWPWSTRLCRAVAVLGLCLSASVQAFTIGHSRVESTADENLQFSVLISGVAPEAIDKLDVRIAPHSSWQEFGLQPLPEVLNAQIELVAGPRPDSIVARFYGTAPVAQSVIDLLFDVTLADEQQRHQVSMLQQPRPAIQLPDAQAASTTGVGKTVVRPTSQPFSSAAQTDSITVQFGDTLHSIAQRVGVSHGTEYQLLAALYQLNPHAFGHENMHMLFAGEQLRMPTAAQIQALSDRQARQLYVEHTQRFNQYKEALARGASNQEATTRLKTAAASSSTEHLDEDSLVDTPTGEAKSELNAEHAARLRLDDSSEAASEASGSDARRAQEKALAHVSQEIEELEDEIDALSQALNQNSVESESDSMAGADAHAATQDSVAQSSESESAEPTIEGGSELVAEQQGQDQQQLEGQQQAQGQQQNQAQSLTKESSTTQQSEIEKQGSSTTTHTKQESAALAVADSVTQQSTDMEPSWIQQHFIKLMLALLAFIIIFTVWILRRANKTTVELESPDRVTDEMIQAKLEDINLDLDVPPSDESNGSNKLN